MCHIAIDWHHINPYFRGFLSDPRVIISLVAYKGTHFSVYNIKMLRKILSTEHTEGTDRWELDGIILGSLRLEIFGGNLF